MKLAVLGGGQLASMLAHAAHPIGIRCSFLDPNPDACAAPMGEHICAAYDDPAAIGNLIHDADCLTFEFENVAQSAVEKLAERLPVYPPPSALYAARDRLVEKRLFCDLDIPTAAFVHVDSAADLPAAVEQIGLPCVLKTRTEGYDGKGQVVLRSAEDMASAFDRIGHRPAILEAFVHFDREVSVIAVRSRSGECGLYALSENEHREGVLRLTRNLARDSRQPDAERYVQRLLEHLEYVGVLALELFEVNGELWANEFAPRVHNSGHWTIEGAHTSQFENHVRAVLGLPLGSTASLAPCAMLNLIGGIPPVEKMLELPYAHVHVYGKQPRRGRKLGHLTLRAPDDRTLADLLVKARALVAQSENG